MSVLQIIVGCIYVDRTLNCIRSLSPNYTNYNPTIDPMIA
jgi:hypothetical protein